MGPRRSPTASRPDIAIQVRAPLWRHRVPDLRARARKAVLATLSGAGAQPPSGIALLFADDAAVRDLNRAYLSKDAPTNVLSFPAPPSDAVPPPLRMLGDVVLAAETVIAEAEGQGKTVADHASHLIVHGVLHLLGFDHEIPAEADAMEHLEVAILGRLGIPDPYQWSRT